MNWLKMLMIYNKREILFPFDGAIFKWRQIGDAAPHSLFSRRSLKRSRLREIQIAGILKEAQVGVAALERVGVGTPSFEADVHAPERGT